MGFREYVFYAPGGYKKKITGDVKYPPCVREKTQKVHLLEKS